MDTSLAMARVAVADGIRVIVATPHINAQYDVSAREIGQRVGELNIVLARAEIPLAVASGAELALTRAADMSDQVLRSLCLGSGTYLLLESPYSPSASLLDELIFDLQVRGFRPVLAHPERCPAFQQDVDRLSNLVERGALCSVTTGSMAGMFGALACRFALRLFGDGLVHNVASDAHDDQHRPPALTVGFARAERHLPGISAQAEWFTRAAPGAILDGAPLPPRPQSPHVSRWRSVLRRLS